ncbi:NAD-dependent epimerase/dehydratase family protein [Hyphomonas johnsonii]|uniref:NAD-dependent epimerase/dehydratase n=1 Tax=Hyphomonas johnsonii MHS-2 TaxID=1280950 RepID=A0A059FME1_9PROT|nr:NAD-dependent epimerase/dehydratase family protein [Hyphomonas johnsonii]KCZ91819.1 NAD-dependent epimerase/dehydratase [Hyphomonas johnsonii MHS-2]
MTRTGTALILGATGGAGYEIARALRARGWQIRALHRRPDAVAALIPDADWVGGDAMVAGDVRMAATNVDLIVHAVNPPGYRNWGQLVLPMIDNTIAAARVNGARIILPGTVYNYGPDAFPLLGEASPQNPTTRKGAIRVELEARLRRASAAGVRALVVRGGDFFGPHMTGNSWFASGLVKPGRPVRSVTYPGRPGVGHAWAYLPDFAEAIACLVDRDADLQPFDTVHFGGHWLADGREIAERTRHVAGVPNAPIRPLPWWLVRVLSPGVRIFRELAEMEYLWKVPVRLDNTKLVRLLGSEPHTPLDVALRATLEGMNCLEAPVPRSQIKDVAAPA